uniref:Amidase domain-containing protein n=1 Tax=Rhabditophanes sp. KR3021 TaxID=114890 RepID=A0AC35TNU7_9BILA
MSPKKIREGTLTSTVLVKSYIERAQEVNYLINAVVIDNYEEATKKAAEVDFYISSLDKESEEYLSLAIKKPLLGIPFTIKCSIKVLGFKATSGITARNNLPPITEDENQGVRRWIDAGGIILSQTNVPECCMWIEGHNSLYGMCNNPYDTRKTPGGSSSGEGAIISSAGSLFGLGSDIAGSIRVPSIFCGVFGYKPSPNVICGTGHVPECKEGDELLRMAYLGPLARYSTDLALIVKIYCSQEEREYLKLDREVDYHSLKFYFIKDFGFLNAEPVQKDCLDGLNAVIEMLHNDNFQTTQVVFDLLQHSNEYWQASIQTYTEDSFKNIWGYMGNFDEKNAVVPGKELFKYFTGQGTEHDLGVMLWGFEMEIVRRLKGDKIKEYFDDKERLSKHICQLLNDDGVLIIPAWPTAAPFHHQLKWNRLNIIYTAVFNALELPVVVVPVHLNKVGMPIAVQIIAAKNNDRILFKVAQEIEKKLGGWREPL